MLPVSRVYNREWNEISFAFVEIFKLFPAPWTFFLFFFFFFFQEHPHASNRTCVYVFILFYFIFIISRKVTATSLPLIPSFFLFPATFAIQTCRTLFLLTFGWVLIQLSERQRETRSVHQGDHQKHCVSTQAIVLSFSDPTFLPSTNR